MNKEHAKFYAERRKRLFNRVSKNSVVLIPSNDEIIRTGDGHYSFRQDSNFYYLTGFDEPNSLAVLLKTDNDTQFILFVRPSDPEKEQWDGSMAGFAGAKDIYQADLVYDINNLQVIMSELLQGKDKVYYNLGANQRYDGLLITWLQKLRMMHRKGIDGPHEIVNLDDLLFDLRSIKDELEKDIMRKAAQVSAAAHCRAMKKAKYCTWEYELEAEFRYECIRNGLREVAYTSIVGSGANTCTLHYNSNNQKIDKNGLVLIDAGGEYEYYAADITRTFPANGKFTEEQKQIYNLVLQAQLAAIEQVKPGNSWDKAQEVILEIITQGLVDLGLIKSNGLTLKYLILAEAYKPFYMHKSGHFLGLDVHDVGKYKIKNEWCLLQPGMVLTIEPGIYIKANMPGVDPKWWNIGVRIEDDVLVTEDGHEILTCDVPKQVAEIERLMNE